MMDKRLLLITILVALLVGCGPPTTDTPPPVTEPRTRSVDGMVMVHVSEGQFNMGTDDDDVEYAEQLCGLEVENCKYEVEQDCEEWWKENEEKKQACLADGRYDCHVRYERCNLRELFAPAQPVHRVTLDEFWIDQFEVSNVQFVAFLNAQVQNEDFYFEEMWYDPLNECAIEVTYEDGVPEFGIKEKDNDPHYYDDHPVGCVMWEGAAAYCNWVGAQLPTEAQWEYAARGPEGWRYPWGDEFDGKRLNYCDLRWEEYLMGRQTRGGCVIFHDRSTNTFGKRDTVSDGYPEDAPVGSFPQGKSWCGALDMAGNHWEWVADWYGGYSSEPQSDPSGPDSPDLGNPHVLRGGSFATNKVVMLSAFRVREEPHTWLPWQGFRCARDMEMWADNDGDGHLDDSDNCVRDYNPLQQDIDSDGVGDACDNCLTTANRDQADLDRDEVGDACDNCRYHDNPDQSDCDEDGVGDVCDEPTRQFSVSPSELVFPRNELLVGEYEARSIIIKNNGADPVSISMTFAASAEFSLEVNPWVVCKDPPCRVTACGSTQPTIPPGHACKIAVGFTNPSERWDLVYSASLTVYSDNPDCAGHYPSVRIPIVARLVIEK